MVALQEVSTNSSGERPSHPEVVQWIWEVVQEQDAARQMCSLFGPQVQPPKLKCYVFTPGLLVGGRSLSTDHKPLQLTTEHWAGDWSFMDGKVFNQRAIRQKSWCDHFLIMGLLQEISGLSISELTQLRCQPF